MPAAYIDRVDTLSMVKRLGVIRSLTRKARVLWGPGEVLPTDWKVLTSALATAGIPADFSTLDVPAQLNLVGAGAGALVLVEKSVEIVEQDPGTVDVVLKYEHLLDGANQLLLDPKSGFLYGKGKTSIAQKPTNFFFRNGDHANPNNRVQIAVAHTFIKDTATAGWFFEPGLPSTVFQGGEVNVAFPQANYHVEGVMKVVDPWAFAHFLIATINAVAWLGKPPRTWICSEVQFDVLDPAVDLWRFGLEFQFDVDTWDPTVVFLDQRTGRPPANVQKATRFDLNNPAGVPLPGAVLNQAQNPITGKLQPAGYWQLPYLIAVDFNAVFGAIFR